MGASDVQIICGTVVLCVLVISAFAFMAFDSYITSKRIAAMTKRSTPSRDDLWHWKTTETTITTPQAFDDSADEVNDSDDDR